jgi:hypothetical protein
MELDQSATAQARMTKGIQCAGTDRAPRHLGQSACSWRTRSSTMSIASNPYIARDRDRG